MTDSSFITSIDDIRRIVTLLSSALMREEEYSYTHLRYHCVVETHPPLANIFIRCRGGSGAIQTFTTIVAPMHKTSRTTRVIFGGIGGYLRHSAITCKEIEKNKRLDKER